MLKTSSSFVLPAPAARLVASSLVIFSLALATVAEQQGGNTSPATQAGSKLTATTNAPPSPAAAPRDERAEEVIGRALTALGGSNYLGLQSVYSRGYFTVYKDGISAPPAAFADYIVFPDRERTEFKSQGVRAIQVNVGDKGWLYDGLARKLSDMSPAQVKDFQLALRASLDNLLRGWWRKEGARLTYVGRREAGLARRNDVVRLTYPDGFSAEFEFGAKDGLPYKSLFMRTNAEGDEAQEEDRFAQHLTLNGVTTPFVIDHFRAGVQTSRINYDKVEFNFPAPDTLFARPADVKSIK